MANRLLAAAAAHAPTIGSTRTAAIRSTLRAERSGETRLSAANGKTMPIHAAPPGEDESLAGRRQIVERMSPDRKEQLRRVEERFLGLDPGEQQHLRQLYAELQEDPDAAKLQSLMYRYCDWLKTLPLYSRGELAELPPDERIKWVKRRLREELAREGGRRLGGKDAEVLWKWMNDCATRHEEAFLNPHLQQPLSPQHSPPRFCMEERRLWAVTRRKDDTLSLFADF